MAEMKRDTLKRAEKHKINLPKTPLMQSEDAHTNDLLGYLQGIVYGM